MLEFDYSDWKWRSDKLGSPGLKPLPLSPSSAEVSAFLLCSLRNLNIVPLEVAPRASNWLVTVRHHFVFQNCFVEPPVMEGDESLGVLWEKKSRKKASLHKVGVTVYPSNSWRQQCWALSP